MDLRDEYSRLVYLYQEAADGKTGNIDEIFARSLEFIDHLKSAMKSGDAEDKKAASRMMKELYDQMQNHSRVMSGKMGMTEEEMVAKSENPANFSPEQWRKMQDSKEKLAKAGEELVKVVQKGAPKKETLPSGPASVRPPESPKKKDPKAKPTKKNEWKRS